MKMDKIFIIAEAGINHNGSIEIAKKLIDAAREAGADAVKFQTFKAENLAARSAPKALYQMQTTKEDTSQLDMLKKLELGLQAHKELIRYCREKGILFLSSPFDPESIEMLDSLGLEIFKIPSGEVTNLPYLNKIGSLKKKLIISSGMSELKEVKDALDILEKAGTPREDITVLHCNTEYPTEFDDVNLSAMNTIKQTLGVSVGYSDHTRGIEVPIAAAALGAAVLEKHFTLDRSMEGPDHRSSLEPHELKAMVSAVRNIEKALGDGVKKPTPSELKSKGIVRKRIVAAKDIREGQSLTEENITTKRAGQGLSPMEWTNVIGKTAKRDFEQDEPIEI